MLSELSVQNLVIVGAARLTPGAGLTVVSGETGAGKSLLLDALDLLLGGRAGRELVGPQGDECSVSAVFSVDAPTASAAEAASGIAASDGQIIIRRRIAANGRSAAWINDQPVTATALKALGRVLVDIRAQHSALALAEPAEQLRLLDRAGGHTALTERYRLAHQRVTTLASELAAVEGGERTSLKELDFLRFQQEEFTALAPVAGELATLEDRQRVLASAGEFQALAAQAVEALGDGPRSACGVLGSFARKLGEAPEPRLRDAATACLQAQEAAREAARLCADAHEALESDPGELARIEARIDAYFQLMRKHGEGEAALLAAADAVRTRIGELEGLDGRRDALRSELLAATSERDRLGNELATARRKAFAPLAKQVHSELADLGMPKARLHLHEADAPAPAPGAWLAHELHVATNPGLPPTGIAACASGGETSRLLLALAVALAEHDRTPVLVFDEVDSGVGGRLGAAIGAKLAALGRERTVLAITHTPQLAAAASKHYVVRKQQDERTTTASVSELSGTARTQEIAEMLGGGNAALTQAKSLLRGAAAS